MTPRPACLARVALSMLLATGATTATAIAAERDSDRWPRPEVERERESAFEREGIGEGDAVDARLPVPRVDLAELRAGEVVAVSWRPVAPEVEEFELIVSIDGGRHWNLRISPELDAGEDRYLWRVPNLAAEGARMRIRARVEGREVWGPEGASFRIRGNRALPRERWLFWETPWWDGDAGRARRAADLAGGSRAPSLFATGAPDAVPPARGLPPPTRSAAPARTVAGIPLSRAATPSLAVFHERSRPNRE